MNKKPNRWICLSAAAWLACAGGGWAQEQKIAFLDLDLAFNGLDKTRTGHGKVEEAKEEFKAEIDAMDAELETLLDEQDAIAEEALSTALSEEIRKVRREEGELKAVEIREFRSKRNKLFKERSQQLEKQILRMRQDIIDEIIETAKTYARNEGYSMVMDSSSMSINQVPIIIHRDKKHDITDAVLELLNAGEQ